MIIAWNYEPETFEALEQLIPQEPFYSLNTIEASYDLKRYKLEDMCKRGELYSERYHINKAHVIEAIPASELCKVKLEDYRLREPRVVVLHQPSNILQRLRREAEQWNS